MTKYDKKIRKLLNNIFKKYKLSNNKEKIKNKIENILLNFIWKYQDKVYIETKKNWYTKK